MNKKNASGMNRIIPSSPSSISIIITSHHHNVSSITGQHRYLYRTEHQQEIRVALRALRARESNNNQSSMVRTPNTTFLPLPLADRKRSAQQWRKENACRVTMYRTTTTESTEWECIITTTRHRDSEAGIPCPCSFCLSLPCHSCLVFFTKQTNKMNNNMQTNVECQTITTIIRGFVKQTTNKTKRTKINAVCASTTHPCMQAEKVPPKSVRMQNVCLRKSNK